MGLFNSVCRPAKTDPVERDLTFSLPPPARPEKNHPPSRLLADSLSTPHLRIVVV
jgi:hypothetical protein